jgi:RNA recognition motif-containing protein
MMETLGGVQQYVLQGMDRTVTPQSCKVFVRNLPSDTTDMELQKLFAPYGTVTRAQMGRDRRTGDRAHFGFVDFLDGSEAQHAIKSTDQTSFKNCILSVCASRVRDKTPQLQQQQHRGAQLHAPHPGMRQDMGINVYLANLPPTYTDSSIRALFGEFGNILSTRILQTAQGKSRGCGFVEFATRAEADAAIDAMNQQSPAGFVAPLIARVARRSATHSQSSNYQQQQSSNPYAMAAQSTYGNAGLVKSYSSAQVQPQFGGYGPARHQRSGGSSVRYEPYMQPQQLQRLPMPQPVYQYTPTASGSFSVFPQMPVPVPQFTYTAPLTSLQQLPPPQPIYTAQPTTTTTTAAAATGGTTAAMATVAATAATTAAATPLTIPGVPLFVFHIPSHCLEQELSTLFGKYGTVAHCKIVRLPDGTSKGYAFVHMSNMQEAQQAISFLNGFALGTKHLKVTLKKAGGASRR